MKISTVYVEQAVRSLPRTQAILERIKYDQLVPCDYHGEIFNRRNQNFRLQKSAPALIIAAKQNRRIMEVPVEQTIGPNESYYFSHMLNCLYDCRYCFLQGMFNSANYVLFVNYE
ncbi:MAG: DNA photolyase, partial [Pseudomonadota bacterium]